MGIEHLFSLRTTNYFGSILFVKIELLQLHRERLTSLNFENSSPKHLCTSNMAAEPEETNNLHKFESTRKIDVWFARPKIKNS